MSARKWFTGPIRQVEAELGRASVVEEPEILDYPDRKNTLMA